MKTHIYRGAILSIFAVLLGITAPLSTAFAQSGPPVIQSASTNQTVPLGNTADFTVSASGSPLSYQWYFNSNSLAGATNTSLVIAPALTNNDGSYQVIITNLGGSATSAVATLTVLVEPNIYDVSNNSSSGSTLLSLASYPGSGNYVYVSTNLALPLSQWQLVATNLAGPNGLFQWLDTNTQGVPAKFYRFTSQMAPVITNVSPIVNEDGQAITITGSGFGTHNAYDGDSSFIEITDVTGNWEAGYQADEVSLDVTSWTTNQITISEFTGAYYGDQTLNPGDTVTISVWNPQTGAGPATYSTTVQSFPMISEVSPIQALTFQTITISGDGFGTNSFLAKIEIDDLTAGWMSDSLPVTSWTNNQITLDGEFSGSMTFKTGDVVMISVWNAQTDLGPATYSTTVQGPAISSVSPIQAEPTQTITISGSGFGTHNAYNGKSEYLEIDDVTGNWQAGYTGNAVNLDVTSWADDQIVISGFGGDYGSGDFSLNAGDTVIISVWNAQLVTRPATYTNTVYAPLSIGNVSPIVNEQTQTITISGSGFGTNSPYDGDSDYLEINDITGAGWSAGSASKYDEITLDVTSWTDNQIVLSGFTGNYGVYNPPLNSGDTVVISVWNPQTGLGPVTYTNIVEGLPAISSVSTIQAEPTQTITITGSKFGTNSPYNGNSDYLEIDDVTAGWSAGSVSNNSVVNLNVTNWATNQIVISGFTGAYGESNQTLNVGDTVIISVWNPQTGIGPATYTNTVEIAPIINSVSIITNGPIQTITITGLEFGTNSPYTNADSDYIEIDDVTGGWTAGHAIGNQTNGITLDVANWTTNQIVISGFGGDYGSGDFSLNSGDTVIISVWNAQTDAGPATYTNTVSTLPAISSVSVIQARQSQTITISGSNFGTYSPYTNGDSDYLEIIDQTAGWTAGYRAATITLDVTSWTTNQITLSGFNGTYGTGNFNLNAGDTVIINVWNPQTGLGLATHTNIVQAAVSISNVSLIKTNQTQTITISGSGFGTNTPYNGDSDYLEIDDVTAGWSAGHQDDGGSNGITLNVTSWTANQITLSGFGGAYGGQLSLNLGDTLTFSVWDPQTGAGATYTTTVETAPVISSVSPIVNAKTQTITISGSNFGTANAYDGDSDYIEVEDVTAGGWNAGYTGNSIQLDVTSWTTNQIVLSGFGGDYGSENFNLNGGDTVIISVWDPQTGLGPAIYTNIVQGPPAISSVSVIDTETNQTITISGSGFGTNNPYSGDSDYIYFKDNTLGWTAGNSNNTITLSVTSWTPDQIVLSGLGGSYGTGNFDLNGGDSVTIGVSDPQTGIGPATYTNIVQGLPVISGVSVIGTEQTQTIAISGNWFGTNSPYTNNSDYIEIDDVTGNWQAGQTGDEITLGVTSWATNQIVLSGFAGLYGPFSFGSLHVGDTVIISVWNTETGIGPATYTNIIGTTPAITSVSTITDGPTQTITIAGSGFGTNSPYTNDSSSIEITDVTAGWNAGHTGNAVTLGVTSWTINQIVLSGFGGSYSSYPLNGGDTVIISVWNAQLGTGPATYTNIVQGPPAISSISPIANEQTQSITIFGSGFGTNSPYTNDSDYISFKDNTVGWEAGYTGNSISLGVTSWTPDQIVLSGFGGTTYGSGNLKLNPGDSVTISVWDPQKTNAAPATYTTTVQGVPTISSVSPIEVEQNQTITITGNWFGTHNSYFGDSDYLEMDDVTRGWTAGYTGNLITLNVTSWADNQIIFDGFGGNYGIDGNLILGDTIIISVWNPQTGFGPATYTNIVTQ